MLFIAYCYRKVFINSKSAEQDNLSGWLIYKVILSDNVCIASLARIRLFTIS